MTLLTLGLILWIAPHFFKRLMPEARLELGDKTRGPISLLLLVGLVFMVLGYRAAPVNIVYSPMAGMGHLNNLLMLLAVFLTGVSATKGILVNKLRNPMLWGAVIWGASHLLTNGDSASILLFGGIIFWGLAQMALINRDEGQWDRPQPGTIKGDIKNLVITLVIYLIAVLIHLWLGYNPFAGSY